MLQAGGQAAVTARDAGKMAELAAQYPDRVLPLSMELADKESIRKAFRLAQERFGRIDVRANNAGHGYRAAVEEGEEENIREVFDTNLFGAVELIKLALPQMREAKSGAIINVSSIAAARAGIGSGYYAATKAALEMIGSALYQEVKPLGIKVMTVEPGAFRTRFFHDSMKGTKNRIEEYSEIVRERRPENIADQYDQPGDPDKAGQVIVEAIGMEPYPRVLPLGSDAVKVLKKQAAGRLEDIQRWEHLSIRSDY